MVERIVKATGSGWRPWALGAAVSAVSMVGAAFLFFRWQRKALDTYEAWWQHREDVRANGHQPPQRGGDRSGNSQLFV